MSAYKFTALSVKTLKEIFPYEDSYVIESETYACDINGVMCRDLSIRTLKNLAVKLGNSNVLLRILYQARRDIRKAIIAINFNITHLHFLSKQIRHFIPL